MSRHEEEPELSDADRSHRNPRLTPKLRGYLYVKHNPTSRSSRARILRRVCIKAYINSVIYILKYGFKLKGYFNPSKTVDKMHLN